MKVEKVTLFDRDDVDVFVDRPSSLNEMLTNSVQSFRKKVAIVDEKESLTYEQLDDLSTRIAANLQVDYGVEKEDRIAVMIGNHTEFPLMVFACAKLGAILVPINTQLMSKEIEFILGNSRPKIIMCEQEWLKKVADIPEAMESHILTIGGEDNFAPLREMNNSLEPVSIDEEDTIFILYTSGTTGQPKGAMISHVNVNHSLLNYVEVFETDETMSTLIAVPIYHVTGLVGQLLHMIYIGGTSYCMKRYKNEAYIEMVLDHKINFLFNVPTIFIMLATTDQFKNHSFDFVKKVAFGGAPIYQDTFNLLTDAFPNANLHNAYGATETTSPATLMPIAYPESKLSSVGLTVGCADIKIMNSVGEECEDDETGEFLVRGPMVIKGYWANSIANQTSFTDGYWHSGDIGSRDADGYHYIYDRKKDMINRGGENVFSIEVENVLKNYPGVVEAAVTGVPDKVFGERIKAHIVGSGLTDEDLPSIKKYCAYYLARYKVPDQIEFLDELPRNAAGKIMKQSLT